jgi:predicted CXXCH cytochrome family protein
MDHATVAAGTCATCHNGSSASGKPANHLPSGNTCDDCHSTNTWTTAVFDHGTVAPGSCTSCHNGVTATGKNATHIATSASCDSCHSTLAWTPATFDHSGVNGSCATCHNGSSATGKPGNHFITNLECNTCHNTNSWLSTSFRHSSASYPGDHSGRPACSACHTSNAQAIPWPYPAYAPDCAACHAGDYKSGPHKNASVSELRNCAGTCHKSSPEHRVSDRDWD